MKIKNVFVVGALLLLLSPLAQAQSHAWVVTKSWTPALEQKFSEFVSVLGGAGCNSLDSCLKSAKANPFYINKTPKDVKYYADCADLPFNLRAYFAWMEGLPFDYVDDVSPVGGGDDVRYSKDGNIPNSFRKIVAGKTYDGPQIMSEISDTVSTAMYRMHYKYVSDFYPKGINTIDIIPGTVLYDPLGHAAIIYKIDSHDGSVHMIDAHPDGSMTHIRFDQKFVRSRTSHGAGFKNWRPEGNYDATESLAGFSAERFNKNYSFNGTALDYYEYVKTVMSGGNLKIDPIAEVKTMINELCVNTTDRVRAVDSGIKSGTQNKAHPETLPNNIYGTSGEWEDFSTPSRDARLKTGFATLVTETQKYVQMYLAGSDRIEYTPKNNIHALAADLIKAYQEASSAPECNFQYTRTNGAVQQLGYDDIVERLFKMSFDPYHCIELRWGGAGSELSSCQDDKNKLAWYAAEQNLRNQIERKYDAVMNFGVSKISTLGVSQAPDVNLEGYLQGLLNK